MRALRTREANAEKCKDFGIFLANFPNTYIYHRKI